MTCWGNDDYGEISEVPTGGIYTQITSGFYHVCALSEDGSATCWGDDNYSSNVSNSETLTSIQASAYNTCGLQEKSEVSCVGETIHLDKVVLHNRKCSFSSMKRWNINTFCHVMTS